MSVREFRSNARMFELQPDRFHSLLPSLRRVPINHLFARSVLEQDVQGRVWIDDPAIPR